MRDEINRLVNPPQPDNSLPAAKTPEAIRSKTGLERTGRDGEVTSAPVTVRSTDGVFTFNVRVIK